MLNRKFSASKSPTFHILTVATIRKNKKEEYIFNSERLSFRKWRNEDLEEFAKLNSDKEVMEHFPKTLSKKEVEDFIEKQK